MSVQAGSILHLAGNNVVDRIQSAGLGDVRVPMETIREVGNRDIVDKVPGEPDFTFTMESLDVSTDLMAFLVGKVGASGVAPGEGDPSGTVYDWRDCEFVNVASPWKDPDSGDTGTIEAGHLIPGYYPTRIRYRFGATENSGQEVELAGGEFFYAEFAPIEEYATGDGTDDTFVTSENARAYRKGGSTGTTFRHVWGVIVDGVLQTEGIDYELTGGIAAGTTPVTITFTTPPALGARIRFSYFTSTAKAYPKAVHATTLVKPGAVRGRNIHFYLGAGAERARVAGIQTAELEATVDGEVERELGTDAIVGRTINGRDATGSASVRAKDKDAFFALLSKVTGVDRDEVFGWFNNNTLPLTIQIENPKNPGEIIKTLYVPDAKFQPPGTPARVNSPTDFGFNWESESGIFQEIKGAFEPA